MPAKRTLDSATLPSSKKQKVEEPATSPFAVDAMIKEIGKYMEGVHLLNYKLICKNIERVMHEEKPKPMEITLQNHKRITKTPGLHFIKVNDEKDNTELRQQLRKNKESTVSHLTVDYCGISAGRYTRPDEFIRTFRLQSIKVIGAIESIVFYLDEAKYATLTSLEIYTTGIITISLAKELDHVKLCSYRAEPQRPTIEIITTKGLFEYAKKIPCRALSRSIFQLNEEGNEEEVLNEFRVDF